MATKLNVRNLRISFWTNNGNVRAVRDISFKVEEGETLAIVGESGSGKSVTAKAIMGILAPNATVEGGEIYYNGMDLLKVPEEVFHQIRGNNISMIFQDPLSSLNPIVRVGKQLTEAMLANNSAKRKQSRKDFAVYAKEMEAAIKKSQMDKGLDASSAASVAKKWTHEFTDLLRKANRIKADWMLAYDAVEVVLSHLEECRVLAIGGTYAKLNTQLKEVYRALPRTNNEFVLNPHEEFAEDVKVLKEYSPKLRQAGSDERAVRDKLQATIESMIERIKKVMDKEVPNFMAIAYAGGHEKKIFNSPKAIKELNESCEAAYNKDFLTDFLVVLAWALEYTYNESVQAKHKTDEALKESLDKLQGDFTPDQAKAEAEKLIPMVKAAINPLSLQKDSFAYTFESAIKYAVQSLRNFLKYDGKKEKKRRKAFKKVHLSESVDAQTLRDNIRLVVRRTYESYAEQIERGITMDFLDQAQMFIRMMDKLEGRKQYRLHNDTAKERAIKIMDEVGIPEPRRRFRQFPFEFSGGMRQRIVIAIALSSNPDILICDEPTTALDVTIQAQILDLIKDLKQKRKLSVIFITHDLGVVANVADRIAVMYAGKIIEKGTAEEVFYQPAHPYTWALLASMPDLETEEKLESIPGTPPDMIFPPKGDAFAARNQYAMKIDFEQEPPLFNITETHSAATWLLHPNAPKINPPRIVTERIQRMTGEAYGSVKIHAENTEAGE